MGSYVVRELLERNHHVRCLVRPGSTHKLEVDADGVDLVFGDITDPQSLEGSLDGCDAVIHLVGIIEENRRKGITFDAIHYQGTVNVADEAYRANVGRFVHMSANGARPDGSSRYQTSKWRGEEYLRSAGVFDWTIFRPTIIFGKPGAEVPEFATRLTNTLVRPFPVLPILGDGTYEIQPVSVEVVARAFVQALDRRVTTGKTYCVAGPDRYTFDQIVDILARALGGEPKRKLHVPLGLIEPVIEAAAPTGLLPISPDQLRMLTAGNTCDPTDFNCDFDVNHKPFSPETLTYLRS